MRSLALCCLMSFGTFASVRGQVLPLEISAQIFGTASSDSHADDGTLVQDSDGPNNDSAPAGGSGMMTAYSTTQVTLQGGDVKGHGYGRSRIRVSDTATSYVQITTRGESRKIGPAGWDAHNRNSASCIGKFDVIGGDDFATLHWSALADGQDGEGHLDDAWCRADVAGWELEIDVNDATGWVEVWWDGILRAEGPTTASMSGIEVALLGADENISGATWVSSGTNGEPGDHSTRYYMRTNIRIEQ